MLLEIAKMTDKEGLGPTRSPDTIDDPVSRSLQRLSETKKPIRVLTLDMGQFRQIGTQ